MIATSQFTISVINDGATGATGPQGISVTKVVEEYRLSNSNTELTGSGTGYSWSETKPDIPSGKYLWIRERTDLSNNTSSYGTAHCDIVISGLVQDVDRNSGVITSKVWESYTQNSINEYDGSTGAAIRDRVTQTETSITGITSRVSDVESETDSLGTRMTSAESSITQNADNIALMVTVDGTSSSITLTQNMLTAMTSQFVIKDPAGSATIISGGKIHANAITTAMLATDAIKSTNYQASTSASSPYSATGAFLDLNTGSLYMPNFGVNGTTGAAYFNGTVNANAGKFGDDTSYWNIETVYDYNMQPHAALVGTGSPYLQTGNWQVSDNAVATRKYTSTSESAGNATYYKDSDSNTFYDVGMKIPTNFGGYSASDSSVTRYNKAFYYGRKYTGNNIPSLDSDWTYFFEIDSGGNVITAGDVYEGGIKLSEKYAAITDVGSAYLPKTGGTITGNLTVNGNFTTNLMIQTNLASTSAAQFTGNANATVTHGVTGTLGVGNGGTGKSTWTQYGIVYATATNALGQMAVGTSGQVLTSKGSAAPAWTSQSALSVGSATKATQDGSGNVIETTYRKLTNTDYDTINVTELTAGNLIVNGAGRFTNGLYGDLTGTASSVENNLKIQLNSGTTEGTNQFTYNGSAAKNINITRSSIGLGAAADKAVDTSISATSTSTNLPTSAAVATFVEGKGYVTSSGVTSITLKAGTGISLDTDNTAITSTGSRTISLANTYGDTKNPYGNKTANYVLAGPSSGSAATPSFRALVAADIPTLTPSKTGLGNVTNDKQIKGLSSGTTSGHLVTWGTDGYTVADSGIASGSVTTKINLSGTDYSVSSNTITISQANLQSAVQSTGLVLMTSAERSKLSSIQVSEGGTIDFSGVTASAPLTATVDTNKKVNITHNTSGVSAGTYRSVTVNTYGHVTAGTNPTTLSGYGITDAKIASGVITLGSNTITPLTASSTLDATKLSGTASISTTGNAGSANSANITTTVNAVAYYTNTTGSFGSKASANGALYATSANGALNWGTLPIAQGGTGKTTSLAAITALGGPYMLIGGTPITENSNLDTGYKAAGTYYSQDSVRSKTLSGTVPNEFAPSGSGGSGFKMITSVGYRTATLRQFVAGASDRLYYRSSQDTGATWTKWYQIVRLPSDSDNKSFSGIGSSTQPVYVNSDGVITAATGVLSNSISGNAATATTSAALTGITSNRFVIGNGTSSAYASSQMSYFNNVDLTVASTTVKRNGIHIWGQTYGNDATKLVSQTAGVMSWGDGGPQITFNSGSATPENGQAGALIFTDHDSCGTGASFHFVSNQTDWNVNSKRFVAKTSMTVGANVPNTSYNLSVTGTANISGATTGASFSASDYISANNSSGTAGGVNLYNRNNGMEYAIMFRQTSNQVKHGFVQSDWATYLTMGGSASNVGTRGWIFKDHVNSKGVASISGAGNMALNGELAIGTTGTDVSGSCSLVMDRNLSCLNFVFN